MKVTTKMVYKCVKEGEVMEFYRQFRVKLEIKR